ncbi:MAG: hypothetical protein HY910_08165 [Desulfarculus sp.]|nr:hypothetical protein [Desulfarculus sp.]
MRVALKFCGGCDPGFERGEYWQAIARAAGPEIEWARLEEEGCQAVLLICGCDTACPQKDMPPGLRQVCLKDDRLAPGQVVKKILQKE